MSSIVSSIPDAIAGILIVLRRNHPVIVAVVCALLINCERKPVVDFPCPGKLFSIDTHSYCAHREYATWNEAKKRCADAGGYLVSINSKEENEALWEILGSTWEHSAWIGFTDSDVEGSWRWVTKEPARYGNWRIGQPDNNQNKEDCAEWLSEDGQWNDLRCSDKRPYLCKSIAGRKEDFRCTGKLFSIGEFEYCANRVWTDWQGARNACEVNGGHLASILSAEENSAIFRNLGSPWGYSGNLWIGFSDVVLEGTFRWESGEAVTFGNWCAGEPNNAGKDGEDCTHLYSTRNCWNDFDCSVRFGFICETE